MEKTEIEGIYKKSEGVFINTDSASLLAYKKRKNHIEKVKVLEQDINNIKSDLQEIKDLLKGLVR